MIPSNDNRPAADARRLLPISGRIGPDGRVNFAAERPRLGEAGADPRFPNDPREA